jgi:hypothetical protein
MEIALISSSPAGAILIDDSSHKAELGISQVVVGLNPPHRPWFGRTLSRPR